MGVPAARLPCSSPLERPEDEEPAKRERERKRKENGELERSRSTVMRWEEINTQYGTHHMKSARRLGGLLAVADCGRWNRRDLASVPAIVKTGLGRSKGQFVAWEVPRRLL